MILKADDLPLTLSYSKKRVQCGVSRMHYCPEHHPRKELMFKYAVNYLWLERQLDSSIGSISDILSKDAGSIPVLVLWSFLISLSCLLRDIHVDVFVLLCMDCPWIYEMITNVGSLLTFISNSLLQTNTETESSHLTKPLSKVEIWIIASFTHPHGLSSLLQLREGFMNVIEILKIPDESPEKGRNFVSISEF